LNQAVYWEAAVVEMKICLSLKTKHHWEIKLAQILETLSAERMQHCLGWKRKGQIDNNIKFNYM